MKRRLILALLIFALAIGASVSGFHISRNDTNQEAYFGDFDAPDRVEITVWITHVDPTLQTVSMTLMNIHPYGKLAVDGNFAKDDTMTMNSIGDWRFQIDRGDSADDEKVQTGITGWLTDYPFDSYDASIALTLTDSDGNDVPTAITVLNTDSFYKIETVQADASDGGTLINLTIRRSTSTLVFGIFIMVLMLALAAASAVAAYYVLHFKRGLDLSACSLMAGMLFALIPLRNAVPGDPPIGSIIDFGSFFIAEATIAVSLISCIVIGYRQQRTIDAEVED
ncbi:DUF4436 family protein [Mycolicibacterium sp.]|uniref:DUF4436 family protein n=1 Tax=Mycolicibacterium sp. TaxID=2320850 RepID=UPI0025EFF02A|nr:DUF4436 family protein [Mycolicibacterium sp.]